jgi:hypothetical protein
MEGVAFMFPSQRTIKSLINHLNKMELSQNTQLNFYGTMKKFNLSRQLNFEFKNQTNHIHWIFIRGQLLHRVSLHETWSQQVTEAL